MGEESPPVRPALEPAWRQGDCALGDHWFAHRLDPEHPLTPGDADEGDTTTSLVESSVIGFMVVTQTCDMARPPHERPYVEVCPLVEVSEADFNLIRPGYRPRFAFVPALGHRHLVADLDRVMTVEKNVVVQWSRLEGARDPAEERALRHALARKRSRVAFPDDFTLLASPLQARIRKQHKKNSPEGEALRALREIRVRASPSWTAEVVELFFYFVRDEGRGSAPDGRSWDAHLEPWLGYLEADGRFQEVDGVVLTLDDMTAREYVESDLLDLDHLTLRPAAEQRGT